MIIRPSYDVVVRAFEATLLLVQVIDAIRAQTLPPTRVIIVDSSCEPEVTAEFQRLADEVVIYPHEGFNFSEAINVGVAASRAPFTMLLSSHVLLTDRAMVEKGWAESDRSAQTVLTWSASRDKRVVSSTRLRDFDGRNGASNSMALYPTHLIAERPFRSEVFSAEDQEWSGYYLRTFRRSIYKYNSSDIKYLNSRFTGKHFNSKFLNEEVAIAYFVKRRRLYPDRIAARLGRAALAFVRRHPDRARMHLALAWALIKANFVKPVRRSRYF